jgi:hypothetical protein
MLIATTAVKVLATPSISRISFNFQAVTNICGFISAYAAPTAPSPFSSAIAGCSYYAYSVSSRVASLLKHYYLSKLISLNF